MPERTKLNQITIEQKLDNYLNSVRSMKITLRYDDILDLLLSLKRERLESGPYPEVSLFEAANRIFSDLVILLGVRRLLNERSVGGVGLPFTEYEVSLGVQGGNDIRALADGRSLVGEAFHVAPSFFQHKKSSMVKKLQSPQSEKADYKLLVFNSDAVRSPDYYIRKSEPSMLYLPLDVTAISKRWSSLTTLAITSLI